MGGGCSSPLSGRQRRYLRGRADATMKNFVPYYRRQLATALLRRLSGELDPRGKPALQLLPSELRGPPDAALHDGLLSRYDGDSCSWQENYFVLLGDFTLRWFESEEAEPKVGAGLCRCRCRHAPVKAGRFPPARLNNGVLRARRIPAQIHPASLKFAPVYCVALDSFVVLTVAAQPRERERKNGPAGTDRRPATPDFQGDGR
ncbi:PREDICTED: niban-like protein 2 [Aptenodytes forsteri]|uniref:niban-like protein 2 n=1 Tax=Aptenodytes forsteri TaxID=9233 RepID=UPI0004F4AC71|nr:PREDICTED: niban-like protein 2 [Aptenodytes forsteri]